MVFYRKYRPQKISELDSASVRLRLNQIMSEGDIPHAFLFTGPKGAGKTSAARIVAKIVNCQKKVDIEPCDACPSCRSISAGTHLDTLEIDAASNRGIEEMRTLRENIRLAPIEARAKVYIIDEVHMLTTEAFNAILKTLEEPPKHVYFILATTDAHKVPETVSSRCVVVEFPKANLADIVRALSRVAKAEKIKTTEEALNTIASQADGSFRDAVKMLEEVSRGVKSIEKDDVYRLSGYHPGLVKSFCEALEKRQAKEALAIIGMVTANGLALRPFMDDCLAILHRQFLDSLSPDLKTLLKLLAAAIWEMRTSPIAALPIEIAVVEWCQGHRSGREENDLSAKSTAAVSSDVWAKLLAAVKKENHSVAAVLRSCKPLTMDGSTAIIETAYKFHFDRLKEKKSMELLTRIISELLGREVRVQPKLEKKMTNVEIQMTNEFQSSKSK